ncbi:MAG: hypothetical protein ACREO5_05585 [Candidatus Binatia bacterium]
MNQRLFSPQTALGLRDKFLRDNTNSKLGEMTVVKKVRISAGGYRTLVDLAADIVAGE